MNFGLPWLLMYSSFDCHCSGQTPRPMTAPGLLNGGTISITQENIELFLHFNFGEWCKCSYVGILVQKGGIEGLLVDHKPSVVSAEDVDVIARDVQRFKRDTNISSTCNSWICQGILHLRSDFTDVSSFRVRTQLNYAIEGSRTTSLQKEWVFFGSTIHFSKTNLKKNETKVRKTLHEACCSNVFEQIWFWAKR